MPRQEIGDYFAQYVEKFNLPVQYGTNVTSVEQLAGGKGFKVTTERGAFLGCRGGDPRRAGSIRALPRRLRLARLTLRCPETGRVVPVRTARYATVTSCSIFHKRVG